jgi:tRNA (mo5U34)-methyltransferase
MAVDENGLFWWHSIQLPDGRITRGEKTPQVQETEWKSLRLPPLSGLTVIDIGAWDGWFSFRAESEGAKRVVALDQFVWSLDFSRSEEYWGYVRACQERNEPYDAWGPECQYWDSRALLGKRSFDHARAALGSEVESVAADFMDCDLDDVGTYDVALFLGVLYHLREPLRALERLRSVTKELAVIETAAVEVKKFEGLPLVEFIHGNEVFSDSTNWFFPTEAAVQSMCKAVGFSSVDTVGRDFKAVHRPGIVDYRLTVHARV